MSFIRHWNRKLTGLDVGHRGSGTSFKANDGGVIRENTIASLKKAGAHGADMVEFDVQLSKDLVPVIYHDFNVYVSLKKKKTLEEHDMLELPMMELTLEQLKNLKVNSIFFIFKTNKSQNNCNFRCITSLKVEIVNQNSLMRI